MNVNPYSCDKLRHETLLSLNSLEGLDSVAARQSYFSQVDDRSTTNNFADLIKDTTRNCTRMVNPKYWIPLDPSESHVNKLADQLGMNWPKNSFKEKTFNHVKNVFKEIDTSFQKKGIKSSTIPGVDPFDLNRASQKRPSSRQASGNLTSNPTSSKDENEQPSHPIFKDPRMKNIDKAIGERILNEVVDQKQHTTWADIAGLENVKQAINEIVVYPMQNPELFQGLLAPAKGLLLFGPPGTGKTLIGKCIACESGATFFAISASSLTSKWIGEGEKMVRALFAVARCMQPSVVFIDEIDSLLTQRSEADHDSTRKLKTEFLVQFDGVSTTSDDRLLVVGATNRPQELDEAARRRFTKRLYVPLPESAARKEIIKTLMTKGKSELSEEDMDFIVEKTAGYSGADMATLCKEAALGPIRAVIRERGSAKNLGSADLPPIGRSDFEAATRLVKASVNQSDLTSYEDWDEKFGASKAGF